MRENMRLSRGFLLLGLMLLLLAWRDVSGNTINPNYVERIKDGQTTKNEIMLLFGEPKEIRKTENGVVYTYKSFENAPALPYDPSKRQPSPQSDKLFLVDEDDKVKKVQEKTDGKILRSTLIIYFKPDGQTVSGHGYTEHK
jgi:outer membrane protein assembly factor BamE (lipoprotein component of BamABCDE complex)